MLEMENKFYMAHQAEFKEKYFDKWLVIAGESLWGVYDKVSDAAKEALHHFESEEFLIHRPADDDTVIEIGPFVSVTRQDDGQEVRPEPVMTAANGELVAFPYAY
jgi:hypothetical protein